MKELWIDITDVPAEGREFSFQDKEVWAEPAKDFGMDISFPEISAKLFVMPQGGDAFLVTGSTRGTVTVNCDRCLGPVSVDLDTTFDHYEDMKDPDEDSAPLIRKHKGQIELDAATILWEQFVLALPPTNVCDTACKGLCPECGIDLNKEQCDCNRDSGDPRLAVLRNLKVPEKK